MSQKTWKPRLTRARTKRSKSLRSWRFFGTPLTGNGYERLQITLKECRYPEGNISSDAFAYLVIQDDRSEIPNFDGWMIASSPALSALEHPRYDVWVTRCTTSS